MDFCKNKRVAIIGAGPSGLAQLRAFQVAQEQGTEIPDLVCFEKQGDWGGLWNYTWRTGLDENGEPVHGSMYRYLWINGPKECLEFSDYSFEEHFGKPIASYAPRSVLWDYIKARVEKTEVRKFIRFNSPVRYVKYDSEDKLFRVTVHDHNSNTVYTEEFDHVVCATGHFSTPNAPFFYGFDIFCGRILHAHDFRDAHEFKDKSILIVGSSDSAEDIGSQCYKYGASKIINCYRTKPLGYDWPENWEEKPNLIRVDTEQAYFKDGTSEKVDAIILCTGYQHHFPFLDEELRLKTDNRLWVMNLYKGVVWEENPKLFYLGMQDQWYTFNMFEAQAWYVRDIILGNIDLPIKDKMKSHSRSWHERERALKCSEEMLNFQGDYILDLIAETDYPPIDTDGIRRTFLQWLKHKEENIMTFRDHSYRSLITGKMSPKHHTAWIDALDDSLEAYLERGTEHKAS